MQTERMIARSAHHKRLLDYARMLGYIVCTSKTHKHWASLCYLTGCLAGPRRTDMEKYYACMLLVLCLGSVDYNVKCGTGDNSERHDTFMVVKIISVRYGGRAPRRKHALRVVRSRLVLAETRSIQCRVKHTIHTCLQSPSTQSPADARAGFLRSRKVVSPHSDTATPCIALRASKCLWLHQTKSTQRIKKHSEHICMCASHRAFQYVYQQIA